MQKNENELRDFIYENHKESFHELISGVREPVKWENDGFPPIRFLLQQIVERKINNIIDGLSALILTGKELRLEKTGESTTRIDLFGNSENIGIIIIELKKSMQTERQSYTELLAYANHFCTVFPGVRENAINTVLVAPMESRTIRDAFVQEVLINGKPSVALIPSEESGSIKLTVYYPDKAYYQWFENNLLDDRSMGTVAIAFPEIDGFIDTDKNSNQDIPKHAEDAFNTISSNISHRLEAEGFHALVYASQKWGEIAKIFPYPNVIYVVYMNPFSSFRNTSVKEYVYGETDQGRISAIQSIYDQLDKSERQYWLENMESNFLGLAIRTVREEYKRCFRNTDNSNVDFEISSPDWGSVKINMIESVFVHNLAIYQTGLLRKIYLEYLEYVYEVNYDELFYYDDLPKYSYQAMRQFLPVWEILRNLGVGEANN